MLHLQAAASIACGQQLTLQPAVQPAKRPGSAQHAPHGQQAQQDGGGVSKRGRLADSVFQQRQRGLRGGGSGWNVDREAFVAGSRDGRHATGGRRYRPAAGQEGERQQGQPAAPHTCSGTSACAWWRGQRARSSWACSTSRMRARRSCVRICLRVGGWVGGQAARRAGLVKAGERKVGYASLAPSRAAQQTAAPIHSKHPRPPCSTAGGGCPRGCARWPGSARSAPPDHSQTKGGRGRRRRARRRRVP